MKKTYIKPTVLCHEFRVEKGFAASNFNATTTQGDRLFNEFNFDNNNRGSFTRSGDNANGIWSDDGSNGGIWD